MKKTNDYLEYDNPYNKDAELCTERILSDEKNPYTDDAKLCTYRFQRMNGK